LIAEDLTASAKQFKVDPSCGGKGAKSAKKIRIFSRKGAKTLSSEKKFIFETFAPLRLCGRNS
jgi:hypothetical protein